MHEYFGELIDFITLSCINNSKKITVHADVEHIYLLLDTAIPCGLILNELLCNSLKHAFPDRQQGKINIKLGKNDAGKVHFSVSDNGVGVPPGFDFRKQDTLGLQTVVEIAEYQLRGSVSFSVEKGVMCCIEFPPDLYTERV